MYLYKWKAPRYFRLIRSHPAARTAAAHLPASKSSTPRPPTRAIYLSLFQLTLPKLERQDAYFALFQQHRIMSMSLLEKFLLLHQYSFHIVKTNFQEKSSFLVMLVVVDVVFVWEMKYINAQINNPFLKHAFHRPLAFWIIADKCVCEGDRGDNARKFYFYVYGGLNI